MVQTSLMHNRHNGYIRYFTSTQRTKINPLKPEIKPYNIYKFSFYLAKNTPHFHYNDQSDNAVGGIIWESYRKRSTMCRRNVEFFIVKRGGTHSVSKPSNKTRPSQIINNIYHSSDKRMHAAALLTGNVSWWTFVLSSAPTSLLASTSGHKHQ